MRNLIITLCFCINLTTATTRDILDEEEFIHAKQFRDEALEVETEVAKLELLARQAADVVEVVAAPVQEERHLGLGLGLQLGPVGAGASAGLGWHGLGVNGLAGYGSNYLQYGQPQHYSQYWAPIHAAIPKPWLRVPGPAPASRTVDLNAGFRESVRRTCSKYAQGVLREYAEGTQRIIKAYEELTQNLLKAQAEQKSRHKYGK